MNCHFDQLTKGTPCAHGCGRKLAIDFPSHPMVACRVKGWGDHVAALLARHGITKARYRAWKVRWGFADACGCGARQEKLNRLGRWVAKCRKRFAAPAPPN